MSKSDVMMVMGAVYTAAAFGGLRFGWIANAFLGLLCVVLGTFF